MKNNIKKMVINGIMNAIANMSITDIMMLDSMLDAIVIKAIANRVPAAPAPATDNTPIERYIKLAQDIVNGSDEDEYDECDLDEREAELNEREEELDEREHELVSRDVDLDNREVGLDLREEELDEREAELNAREAELDAREADLDDDVQNDEYMSVDDEREALKDVIVTLISGIADKLGGRR